MSRGLGIALTLSVLAHGGAVATVGVLGAAWLTGSPSAPPPAALYVDLVHPVVATSDRPAAADPAEPRSRGIRPVNPAASPTRRHSPDVAPPAERPAVASVAPVEPERPAPVAPTVPPPPGAPGWPTSTDARSAPTATTAPAKQTPAPAPLATAPAASPVPSVPVAPAPAEAPPRGAMSDVHGSSTWALAPSGVTSEPPSGLAAMSPAAPSSRIAAPPRQSRDPGTEDPGDGTMVVAGRDHGGPSPLIDGSALARLSPGDAQEGAASDGAIPPEYESYVGSLRQRIQDRLVYPWTAVRRGQQGVIELEVRVGPDGRLVAVEVVAGASAESLRAAAVAAVRGSAPFPFPPGLAARLLVVRLPVEFRLR